MTATISGRWLEHDWFTAVLPDNVEVGARTWIYSAYAFLHYRSEAAVGVRVGHDTGIYNGTFFDLGPRGQVLIGSYCSVVGAIFCTNRRVIVGDYTFIAHAVKIADSFAAVPPRRVSEPVRAVSVREEPHHEAAQDEAAVVIGENAWIGAKVTLLAGTRIGEAAVIGAGTVVDFEVPAGAVVAGSPARVVGWAHQVLRPPVRER